MEMLAMDRHSIDGLSLDHIFDGFHFDVKLDIVRTTGMYGIHLDERVAVSFSQGKWKAINVEPVGVTYWIGIGNSHVEAILEYLKRRTGIGEESNGE